MWYEATVSKIQVPGDRESRLCKAYFIIVPAKSSRCEKLMYFPSIEALEFIHLDDESLQPKHQHL